MQIVHMHVKKVWRSLKYKFAKSKNVASRSQSEVENGRKNKTLNCAETIDFDGKSFHFLGLIVRT